MDASRATAPVCAQEDDAGPRFLRWLAHPHCARCRKFVLTCGEHWFCDLCQNCREYYATGTRSVRQFVAAKASQQHRRVHARV